MLFTAFWIDYPILREALSAAPDVTITWEQSDLTEDGSHQMLVWADGDGYDAFETGLEADATVEPPSRVVEFGDRRLYQLELTPTGKRQSVYPVVLEEGSLLRRVTATHEGWHFRAVFPSEDALERFHQFLLDNDIGLELQRLYKEQDGADSTQFGLTDQQRETLVTAVDAGYLDIPRSCSLAELGEAFDISPNATSERFRRGVKALIEETVYPNAGSQSETQ
ncbi:helix-turn-helix domain-containing protein [Natronorubrum aibiense]|uniref:Bacterio-opsin activator n=1 Tax=Natronorubrum aibiense TaxID=348826 RepID=A0A5P9NZW6_9EURY|nr:helix-turn-helix domain-containing protein [Natronorubrum aibiense]QFU81434.1 bacterio-opsin activator [Natronorubrum aibiense]